MKRVLLFLTLLAASYAWSFSSPYSPDECGASHPYTTIYGNVCLIYGGGHVYTFDGMGYHPDLMGDYFLVDYNTGSSDSYSFDPEYTDTPYDDPDYSTYFSVQGRWEPCENSKKDKSCLTGVALRYEYYSVAFYFDYISGNMAITQDGKLTPFLNTTDDYYYNEIYYNVVKQQPNAGYYVVAYFDGPDFYVTIDFSIYGSGITIEDYNGIGRGGLCGYHDSCEFNDLFNPHTMQTVPMEYSVPAWHVNPVDSIFEIGKWDFDASSTEYPFVFHAPIVPYQWAAATVPDLTTLEDQQAACARYQDGHLYEACIIEEYRYKNHDSVKIGTAVPCRWLAERKLRQQQNVNSWITNMYDLEHNCSDHLDYTMSATETHDYWTLHDVYSSTVPGVVASATGYTQDLLVLPPLGGTYTFDVVSQDCCDGSTMEVVLDVQCDQQVSVVAMDDFTVQIDEFWLPYIMVTADAGDVVADNVHISWKFISWPGIELGEDAPYVMFPFSTTAYFQPASWGDYIIRVVATDGCSIATDILTVSVACMPRVWFFDTDFTDTITWFGYETGSSPFTYAHYTVSTSCPVAMPLSGVYYDINLNWEGADPFTLVARDDFYGSWDPATEQYYTLQYTISTKKVVTKPTLVYTDSDYDSWSDSDSDLWDGQMHEYYQHRVEATIYDNYRIDWSEAEYEGETTWCEVVSAECLLSWHVEEGENTYAIWFEAEPTWYYPGMYTSFRPLTTSSVEYTQWAYAQTDYSSLIKAHDPYFNQRNSFSQGYEMFGFCEGLYSAEVTFGDDFACEEGVDKFYFDVSCERSPRGLILTPCFDVYYDYDYNVFHDFIVNAQDSDAMYDRNTESIYLPGLGYSVNVQDYYWTFDSSSTPYYFGLQWNYAAAGLAFTAGTHKIKLHTTDFCRYDTYVFERNFICNSSITSSWKASGSNPAASLDFPYDTPSTTLTWVYDWSLASASNPDADVSCLCTSQSSASLLCSHDDGAETTTYTIVPQTLMTGNTADSKTVTGVATLTDTCATSAQTNTYTIKCTHTITLAASMPSGNKITYDPYTPEWTDYTMTNKSYSKGGSPVSWADLFGYTWWYTNGGYTYNLDGCYGAQDCDFPAASIATPGTYNVYLQATDLCKTTSAQIGAITLACASNTVTAQLTASMTSVYLEDLDPDNPSHVYLYGNKSSLGSVGSSGTIDIATHYVFSSWVFKALDVDGNVLATCTVYGSSGSYVCSGYLSVVDFNWKSVNYFWVPRIILPAGLKDEVHYTAQLTVSDGCQSKTASAVAINVVCNKKVTAKPKATPSTATFANGKFPSVCVDGESSTLPTHITWKMMAYDWIFTSAPADSMFAPIAKKTTLLSNSTYKYSTATANDPDYNGGSYSGCYHNYQVSGWEAYKQTYYRTVSLNAFDADNGDPNTPAPAKYGACFRPDVAGTYKLQLNLALVDATEDYAFYCYENSAEVSVSVKCNTAPVSSFKVSASPTALSRVSLTSSSTDADSADELTYEWALILDGVDISYLITNAHAAHASFVPPVAGTYTAKLTVFDGCSYHTSSKSIEVACGYVAPKQIKGKTYTYDGFGNLPISLHVPEPANKLNFEWVLTKYEPFVGESASAAVAAPSSFPESLNAGFYQAPAFALLVVAALVAFLF